jgi:S-adenosylmethionine-diacylglycerol 3-amino-3-carboxypropyl transferase
LETTPTIGFSDRVHGQLFNALYSRALVYTTCWEDPAVDRVALRIGREDSVMAISSAGCNVLDYALDEPRRIDAVDANPRQTALLELKMAGIRALCHDDFFRIFGHGVHADFDSLYRLKLRDQLSTFARAYWDRRLHWFSTALGGFYFRGLSGVVAQAFRLLLKLSPRLAAGLEEMFSANCLEEQRSIYRNVVCPKLWRPSVEWVLSRQLTLSLLGVPCAQRQEVIAQHANGVAGFIRESMDYLAHHIPFRENYFYAVYLQGRYTPECCPGYLKPDGFARLKGGLVDRVHPHTGTVTSFLADHPLTISRFVLLDHMDWMSSYQPSALVEEWEQILRRAAPGTRLIFRSARARPSYLDGLKLAPSGKYLREILRFDEAEATRLTRFDRVHTYAGFHIAELVSSHGIS